MTTGTVTIVRDKDERYIKGVYTSPEVAQKAILEQYGEDAETEEEREEILERFDFLEFLVES